MSDDGQYEAFQSALAGTAPSKDAFVIFSLNLDAPCLTGVATFRFVSRHNLDYF